MEEKTIKGVVIHDSHGNVVDEAPIYPQGTEELVTQHNADPEAHPAIREAIVGLRTKVERRLVGAKVTFNDGHTEDVELGLNDQGEVILLLPKETFGKIDGVKVNGEELPVDDNGKVDIPIPTTVHDLDPEDEYATKEDAQAMVDEAKVTGATLDYQEDGGSPSATVDFIEGSLGFKLKNMKMKFSELEPEEKEELRGPQGIPGEGAIWTGQGEEIMTLAQETGNSIGKAMSQKAVTDALVSQIESQDTEPDLEFTDENGRKVVEFSEGHIKTQAFDSKSMSNNVSPRFSEETSYSEGDVTMYGEKLYKFVAGHLGPWSYDDVAETSLSEEVSKVNASESEGQVDLEFTDTNNNAIAQFSEGHIKTQAFDSRDVGRLEQLIEDATTESGYAYYGEKINPATHRYKRALLFTEIEGGQGACCYGAYLFQFFNTHSKVDIYNMNLKERVQRVNLTAVNTYHCNSANFGNEFYDETDDFPLLYVSMENEAEHKCLVYRVTFEETLFTLTLVQTITFPVPSASFLYYPNVLIDCEKSKMIVNGLGNYPWSTGTNNTIVYKTFTLPKLSEGDVTLSINDVEDTISIPRHPTGQGGFVLNGRIFQVLGMNENAMLIVTDIAEHRVVSEVNLAKDGLAIEPEGCFAFGDCIHVNFYNGKIYKFKF